MKGHKRICFLIGCFVMQTAYCQHVIDTFSAMAPVQEKMYAHTDKNVYIAGEVLWFTLYNVNAATGHLFDLSKIAYVELVDSLNKPAAQVKIPLHRGVGNGSFIVSPSLSSGSYKLRVYTSWMKNGSVDDFFQKDITVINVQKLTVSKKGKEDKAPANYQYLTNENLPAGKSFAAGRKITGANDTLSLALSSEKSVYERREKVTLSIQAEGSYDSAFLSLSVYRIDSLQALDEDRIDNYLSAAPAPKTGQATPQSPVQNYPVSRKETSRHPLPAFAPEYDGHIITGKILSRTGKPESGVIVYLSVQGKGTQLYPAVSDIEGNIRWETKDFYSTSKLVVQTKADSGYTIRIDDPFSHFFSSSPFAHFALPYHCPNTLAEHSISMQVAHIYTEAELEQYSTPVYDTVPFYAVADKTYRLDDFTRFNTLEEVLREYVALANVTKRRGDFHLPVFDNATQKMFTDDPLLLLDGVPYFNFNRFMAFDPQKIQKVDVVFRRFFYGAAIFDGVLNWQSYGGDLAETSLDPNAAVVDYEGLALQRKFYSPSYETEELRSSHLPDFRNVLYWNPDITIKEKQQLSFYTSDLPGKYVAVVQGITQNGLAGSRVVTFDVR